MPRFLEAEYFHPDKKFLYIPSKMNPDANKEHPLPNLLGSKLKVINISGNVNSQTETSIAINPLNPKVVVGTSNDSRYNSVEAGYKMAAYYTSDGGYSWAISNTPSNLEAGIIKRPTNGGMTNFDPGVAFDSKGNCYYVFGFCQTPDFEANGDNGVFVSISKDGGKNWGSPVTVIKETKGTSNQAFHDRYSITSDISTNSPYKDNVYITWMKFYQNDGIAFSKSTDGGASFSSHTIIPGKSTSSQSPFPACGPNGEIYVVWQNKSSMATTDIYFQKSTDGGNNWLATAKNIQTVTNIGMVNSISGRSVLYDKQSMRVSSYPQVAVDNSNGARRGTIYVVQAGKDEYAKTGIFITKSNDGGTSWFPIQKIDGNVINNDVFLPSISVDPITGTVAVVYYSSQNDPENKGVDAYLSVSSDGFSYKNYRLSENTWYLSGAMSVDNQGEGNYYYGDYTGVAAYDGNIYPCFWMPNSPNGAFWTNNAYTALISNAPDAPNTLKAQNDYQNPTQVALSWYDPSQDLLGNALGDFEVVIYRSNTEIAKVKKGVRKFTDNGAVDGEVYSYSISAKLSSGKESELVGISGIAGGGLEPMPPTDISSRPVSDGLILNWQNPDKHTDGTLLHDFEKIEVFSSNTLLQTISKPEIQIATNGQIKLNLPAGKYYELKLRAVSLRSGKFTPSVFSDSIIAYAGNININLTENFDGSNELNAWSNGAKQSWAKTTAVSYSAPNCITDSPSGKYQNNYDNEIRFAPVKITSDNLILNFRHVAVIDITGDYGLLRVSKDFGKSWDNIGWFNSDSSDEFTGDVTTSKWQFVKRDLSKYVGDTLLVSFVMHANPVINKDGWFIDNLNISNGSAVVDELNAIYEHTYIQSEPNPVLSKMNLRIGIPVPGIIKLEISDIYGRNIQDMDNSFKQAGEYNYSFSADNLAQGVYLIKLTVNGISTSRKFVKL